jgi:glycosyltransferase involved in cell wall biosynthesis
MFGDGDHLPPSERFGSQMTTRKIKVTHIITGLPRGGAQSVLVQLLHGADSTRFDMDVISLTETGPIGELLSDSGIPVRALNMGRRVPNPGRVLRLASWIRQGSPDIVQTWLYHGDLVGGLAARLAGCPVMWNLRQSDLDLKGTRRSTLWTVATCARLSRRIPETIVCCSEASRSVHRAQGYDGERMVVIGNGVDLGRFKPSEEATKAIRREIGVDDQARLIGLVARFHPQKDHQTFVQAAGEICSAVDDVHFVLCGEDINGTNADLGHMIRETGFGERFHLLGIRDDIPQITGAFDLAVSSSFYGEGSANVLLEAMACGVPCATTDVGDSALIADGPGWVVPPRNAPALAVAMLNAMELTASELNARGAAAREIAEKSFSISTMVDRYETLYTSAVLGR